jgi:hypothetical protein
MFYPTGNNTGSRCLVCMKDEEKEIRKAIDECQCNNVSEAVKKWLDEKCYCVESWQMKNFLKECGLSVEKIEEDMGAAPAAPMASLNTTPGMGNPTTPTNDGTNSGCYDVSKTGSGDLFPSLGAGGKKKKKNIISFLNFIKK